MARIRTIKPDFFKSEDVSTLPFRARLTWIGLWTHCDDHGRYKDSVRLIKGDVWSLDDVSLRDIEEDLQVLTAAGRIVRYTVAGELPGSAPAAEVPRSGVAEPRGAGYLAVVNWHTHQAINRPSKPRYPAPPMALGSAGPDDWNHCPTGHCVAGNPDARLTESVLDPHGTLTEGSLNGPGSLFAGHGLNGGFTEDSVSTHGGLTPGREGKGTEGRGRAHAREAEPSPIDGLASEPPPPKCPAHIDHPNPPPCGGCADARRSTERWVIDRARALANAPKCRRHRGQPAHNCGICRAERLATDDPDPPPGPAPPDAERARRGAAAVRAALPARPPPSPGARRDAAEALRALTDPPAAEQPTEEPE